MKPRSRRPAPPPLPRREDFPDWRTYADTAVADVEQRVEEAESGRPFDDAFDLYLRAVTLAPGEHLTLTPKENTSPCRTPRTAASSPP